MAKKKSWAESERELETFGITMMSIMFFVSLAVILITGVCDWYSLGHLVISAFGIIGFTVIKWFD